MEKLVKKRRWRKTSAALFVILVSLIIIMVPIGIISYLLIQKGKYYMEHPELLVQSLRRMQVLLKTNYNISVLSEENIVKIRAYATSRISSVLNEGLSFLGQ
jgi:predicted PurR-regulated permease PerM